MITELKRLIEKEARDGGFDLSIRANLERPELGDLSAQLYQIARKSGKSIESVYTDIAGRLTQLDFVVSSSLDNGYINIKLNWNRIFERFCQSVSNFFPSLHSKYTSEKPILVEYSQPNTHKPFHVGHLRNACLGSSLVNLLRRAGYTVVAINYPGDIGTHVARCIWYLEKFKPEKPKERLVDFLGNCYTSAVSMLELENLSDFPHTDCIFGEIVHHEGSGYKVRTAREMVEAAWSGNPIRRGEVVVLATKSSKIFKLLNTGAAEGSEIQYKIVPQKFLKGGGSSELPIVADGDALEQDPVNYFRYDKTIDDVLSLYHERNREVSEVLVAIEQRVDPWYKIWQETRQWCLDELEKIYSWLGCPFDKYYFESELTEDSQKLVEDGLRAGVFTIKNGAVGIDLGNLGFLVLRKSDGSVLYATRDISLAYRKMQDFDHGNSYYVVDQAQSLHFKQVFETLGRLGFGNVDKLKHLGYALVITKEGKISSRSSNYYTFWQLKELATETILNTYYANGSLGAEDSSVRTDETARKRFLSEKLAKACIRYGMLKVDANTPVVFDLNEWLDVRGNSGAYILYTYARFKALLDKASEELKRQVNNVDFENLKFEPEEIEVLRMMLFFDEWFSKAVTNLSPNVIAEYLYLFAQALNKFYNKVPILKSENHSTAHQRVLLVRLSVELMEGCFSIMGIDPLDRV